jgi:hypothetical protein
MAAPSNGVSPQQANAYSSMLVRQRAKRMVQRTYRQIVPYTFGTGNVVNIPLRPVGLLTGLKVVVEGTITTSAAGTGARTDTVLSGVITNGLGAPNVLSNISLVDLSSNTRVNAPGWYLHALASVRRNSPYLATYAANDTAGYAPRIVVAGALGTPTPSYLVNSMPEAIGVGAGITNDFFRHIYDVPVAYGPDDLRGAIYAAVTSATLNLQVTINPNLVSIGAVDSVESVYNATAGAITDFTTAGFTISVYQEYFDMLPVDPSTGLVILPPLDLAKAYMINSSVYTGLAAGAQFPVSFANWREFQSTLFVYKNTGILGALAAAGGAGGNITDILLQSANLTNIMQLDPALCQAYTRERIGTDMPYGMYYIDLRRQPIITQEFGNMQLTVTPSAAGATPVLYVGWEAIADQNTVMLSGAFRQN